MNDVLQFFVLTLEVADCHVLCEFVAIRFLTSSTSIPDDSQEYGTFNRDLLSENFFPLPNKFDTIRLWSEIVMI